MAMNSISAKLGLLRKLEQLAADEGASLRPDMARGESDDSSSSQVTNLQGLKGQNSDLPVPGKPGTENEPTVDLKDLLKGYEDPQGRRLAERFEISLPVVVYSLNRSFRTTSINVSAGGVLLSQGLPGTFTSGEVQALFVTELTPGRKEYFMVSGSIVDPFRIQFTSATAASKEALQKLIQNLKSLSK